MNDLIQKTLAKINQERIVPEPRWKFLARKFFLWLVAVMFVALGALAAAVIGYLLLQLDWDVHPARQVGFFRYSVSLLPYFWLFMLAIFLVGAAVGMRKTENGYRFSWMKMGGLILGGLVALGLFTYGLGWGRSINHLAMEHVPYLMQHTMTKEKQWMQPERGMLAGTILDLKEKQFQMKDLTGGIWTVEFDGATVIRPAVNFAVGQKIKIIGAQKNTWLFSAEEIRPWTGRGLAGQGRQRMLNNLSE